MRVLLDECLPRRLKRELSGHDVRTVPEMAWAGRKNSELLRLAAPQFDVFLTVDRGLEFQQNIPGFEIAIVALRAPSNDVEDLLPLMPAVREVLPRAKPGEVVRVSA